ncbi:transcriptional regulator [Pseudoclavibacter sp. AY1F1]|uniref:winged helix-turn-helix transcriptional regulator n=1 Tax=Pseudoclavibacter sp. AY1F1 TaxID=2080583 RepID=UPI000CE8765F|nr:helix-turn-helix domain-containing protein [Pseudoclavibacter sp. AY1F1]PPF46170.1 transcriptional regulator [Pseudoclavibacter sp. AY1F1]
MSPKWNVFSATCPSRTSLAQIANKWTAMIVITVSQGPKRFSELHRMIEGISKKVLVDTLRSLERDGMLERTSFEGHRVYALTPLGASLEQPLLALQVWAEEHIEEVLVSRDAFDERADDEVLAAAHSSGDQSSRRMR